MSLTLQYNDKNGERMASEAIKAGGLLESDGAAQVY